MEVARFLMKLKRRAFDATLQSLRKRAHLGLESATISDGEIAYLDNKGRAAVPAETLVMLHGLGADKDTWLHVSRHLTGHLRLVAPDLAGHGASVRDYSLDYGVKAQARRMLELLDVLNIGRAHVVGSSMGGAVAAHLARMRPEAVLSLGLIDSYGAHVRSSYVDELAEGLGYNPMLEVFDRHDYRKMMSLGMSDPPYIPGFMLDVLVEDMQARSKLNGKIYEDSLIDSDLTDVLAEITVPSLVIWGADDKVLHVDNMAVLQKSLRDCTSVVLEETGHVPMVERPELTAEHIKRFIGRVGAAEDS